MSVVVVEQRLGRALTPADLRAALARNAWCRELYGVTHLTSFVALDGASMICIFDAPDAEAVRTVADRMGYVYERIWAAIEVTEAHAV